MAWIFGLAVKWFGGGFLKTAVEKIADAVGEYHHDTEQAESVAATMREKSGEIAAKLMGKAFESKNAYVADAAATILWVGAVTLAVALIPHNVVVAWFWVYEVFEKGGLIPYPIDVYHLANIVALTVGIGGLQIWKGKG